MDTIAAPVERLKARCTIVQAFMCLSDCERYLPRSVELLSRELEMQIALLMADISAGIPGFWSTFWCA